MTKPLLGQIAEVSESDGQTTTIEPPKAPEAERKPLTEWAREAGMQPDHVEGPTVPGSAAGVRNPDAWKFHATKAFKRWTGGELVTRDEFEQAVKEALNPSIR